MIMPSRHIRHARVCSWGSCLSWAIVELVLISRRSHLPLLFVGMEQIVLSNHALADEALNAANAACDSDPLLMNELGVMAFTHGE